MKKLLFVLALGVFAACGNGDNNGTGTDSSSMMNDSSTMVTPAPMDTMGTMDDSSKMMKDSSKM